LNVEKFMQYHNMPEQKKSDLQKILDNLNERNKELSCIYKVDELLRQFSIPFKVLLEELTNILPEGYRYSDICKVKISYGEFEFNTEGFKITDLMQSQEIRMEGKTVGNIYVCYIKPLRMEKGVFLPEETRLLSTIAQKLSDHFIYRKLRETIESYEENQVKLTHNALSDRLISWLQSFHLSNDEIEKFTKAQLQFKKGEIICKQGAITSYIMILADGLSKNYLEGVQDKGFNFSIVKAFDFIGLSSLYNTNTYLFSGSAITPCTIYHIEKEAFKSIIKQNTSFAEEIMNWYCKMTKGHLERMSCLANKQALGRIADILLYLSDRIFYGGMIENIISRKDIAELAGMSTESAVRILSELNRDKIIHIVNKGIEITDEKLLRKLSMVG